MIGTCPKIAVLNAPLLKGRKLRFGLRVPSGNMTMLIWKLNRLFLRNLIVPRHSISYILFPNSLNCCIKGSIGSLWWASIDEKGTGEVDEWDQEKKFKLCHPAHFFDVLKHVKQNWKKLLYVWTNHREIIINDLPKISIDDWWLRHTIPALPCRNLELRSSVVMPKIYAFFRKNQAIVLREIDWHFRWLQVNLWDTPTHFIFDTLRGRIRKTGPSSTMTENMEYLNRANLAA